MPERTCVGCKKKDDRNAFIRFSYYNGIMSFDSTGTQPGRGAYLCGDSACLEKAKKNNGFSRTFRCRVSNEEIDRCFREYLEKFQCNEGGEFSERQ